VNLDSSSQSEIRNPKSDIDAPIDWLANVEEAVDVTVMAEDVCKYYHQGQENEVRALGGVSLEVYTGEYIAIVGPSGSGKSTLFNCIGGLTRPTGYIFQSYNIVKVMTALENVTLPMLFAGVPGDEAQDRGVEILKRVGLGDRLLHTPKELSGGQQQRVAIARAFANNPAIILADEPTANLDLKTGEEIIDLMRAMNEEQGVTVICATHDYKMLDVTDRIVWMEDGLLKKIAKRGEIEIKIDQIAEN